MFCWWENMKHESSELCHESSENEDTYTKTKECRKVWNILLHSPHHKWAPACTHRIIPLSFICVAFVLPVLKSLLLKYKIPTLRWELLKHRTDLSQKGFQAHDKPPPLTVCICTCITSHSNPWTMTMYVPWGPLVPFSCNEINFPLILKQEISPLRFMIVFFSIDHYIACLEKTMNSHCASTHK